jgi:hypothetical protein
MSVSNILNKFGKRVVKEAKTKLTKDKKNASKELYDSISYEFKEHNNSFSLAINMADYGKFIDKGVSGKGASNFNGKKKTVFKSEGGFKFGSGNFKGKGGEWKLRIDKWMYSRGIAPRDKKTGKFVKRDTVNYLIRRSIYQHGTKASNFLTKPFNSAFKSLPDEVVEAYGLEVDKLLDSVLN